MLYAIKSVALTVLTFSVIADISEAALFMEEDFKMWLRTTGHLFWPLARGSLKPARHLHSRGAILTESLTLFFPERYFRKTALL